MTENQLFARAETVAAQAWKSLQDYYPDIERIAKHGPDDSERDKDIIRMIFHCVAGEIHIRAYKATHVDVV